MTDAPPLFTVFTATYQRAHTIERVWKSLNLQTFTDFEWIVVDDGSTDGTAELLAGWCAEAPFPVRYITQEHGGKHKAFNRAVSEARGTLFLNLDSDDECFPEALERFAHHWHAIPADARAGFTGVTALCSDAEGGLVGSRFPSDPTDSDSVEIRYRHQVTGEKWGFNRVDVLREHPFPVVAGQPNVPESLVWHRIARSYRTRFVNEPLRTYHVQGADSITVQSAARATRRAPAFAMRAQMVIDEEIGWFRTDPLWFVRAGANYSRFSWAAGTPLVAQSRALTRRRARLLHALTLPLGVGLHLRDRRRAAAAETTPAAVAASSVPPVDPGLPEPPVSPGPTAPAA